MNSVPDRVGVIQRSRRFCIEGPAWCLVGRTQEAREQASSLEARYKETGIVDFAEVQEGNAESRCHRGQLTEDTVQDAETRLAGARARAELLTPATKQGEITVEELNKAQGDVTIDEAKLAEAKARALSPGISFGPARQRVFESSNPGQRALNLASGEFVDSGPPGRDPSVRKAPDPLPGAASISAAEGAATPSALKRWACGSARSSCLPPIPRERPE